MQSLEVVYRGQRAVVEHNDGHPEGYLWIRVEGALYFLGVLVKGMTRGDVRRLALAFLQRTS